MDAGTFDKFKRMYSAFSLRFFGGDLGSSFCVGSTFFTGLSMQDLRSPWRILLGVLIVWGFSGYLTVAFSLKKSALAGGSTVLALGRSSNTPSEYKWFFCFSATFSFYLRTGMGAVYFWSPKVLDSSIYLFRSLAVSFWSLLFGLWEALESSA